MFIVSAKRWWSGNAFGDMAVTAIIVEPLSKGHPEERTLGKSKSHMSYDNLQSAMHWTKLLSLVYDILPSTTAVFS